LFRRSSAEGEGSLPHGGRLEEARRRWPNAPTPFVDLSTGINPHGYPLPPLPPDSFSRLPEPEAPARLETIAAEAYGVADPACVVAAPGTQALIQLLPRLMPAQAVTVLGPTYNEHAQSWRQAGLPVDETNDATVLRDAEVAVLCNPNNPDGTRHRPEDLFALGRRVRLLAVDEAFADLEPEPLSLVPHMPLSSVVILRSFGKTYGLAGLRLGFAIASPERAATLRALLGPWAVSGPAIAVGSAALADAAWRSTMRERLQRDVARLDALLRQAGLQVLGGTLLFRLAEGDSWLAERLGQAGILVRAFPFAPTWIRFGIPGDEATWERLARALSS
jgi:cobalamin biosynthetic protein CobC